MNLTTGLLLTICSGLCWGALDALRKRLAAELEAIPLTAWLLIGQWPIFALWSYLSGQAQITAGWLAPGLSVSVIGVCAALLFIRAVQLSPLSLVIPMLSLTPVFAVFTSAMWLGEVPERDQLIGVGLVVSGAFTLGRASAQSGGRGWREPGVWMMAGVALCWACTLTLDKVALEYADAPMHALAQSLIMGLGLLAVLAVRQQLHKLSSLRNHIGLYCAVVLVGSLATGLQLVAIQTVLVGVVEGIKRSLGLALALLNGWVFFGESLTRLKLFAVIWMGFGVLFLVL